MQWQQQRLEKELLLVPGGDHFDRKWDKRTEEALLAEIHQLVFLRNGNHLVVYVVSSERSIPQCKQIFQPVKLSRGSCQEELASQRIKATWSFPISPRVFLIHSQASVRHSRRLLSAHLPGRRSTPGRNYHCLQSNPLGPHSTFLAACYLSRRVQDTTSQYVPLSSQGSRGPPSSNIRPCICFEQLCLFENRLRTDHILTITAIFLTFT